MTYVYVFQSGVDNLYKIGRIRGDAEKQRKDLSTGNPHPLTTIRGIETDHDSPAENLLHKKFTGELYSRGDTRELYELDSSKLKQSLKKAEEFMAGNLLFFQLAEQIFAISRTLPCSKVA